MSNGESQGRAYLPDDASALTHPVTGADPAQIDFAPSRENPAVYKNVR